MLNQEIHPESGSGAIWIQCPLAYAVIPAKAGIQCLDDASPEVSGLDSRFRGNDGVGPHPFDASDVVTRNPEPLTLESHAQLLYVGLLESEK